MEIREQVKPPSKQELITLRLMIFIGIGSMFYFLNGLFTTAYIGYAPLYWLLMSAIIYNSLKSLHEWYHYFYITIPQTPPHTKTYTVDIFTTFCKGEPYPMIIETLTAIQAITYPHNTYLCDESNDPFLINLCNELGVKHVTRTLKINAKAGNINNALNQSTGELCVVLDPDHVPSPDFLDPIISHFDNPEIGFVQIVQAYENFNESLIAKGSAQQTFQFYGPMMMTMNKYGTVLAIGANCTFRRTALESIGGHAAGLAEDMHTAMQLHAKGWKSVYVPAILTRGLVPSTLSAYYKQQLKWSRGVFELLVATYPSLFNKFTWRQKIHYGTIPLHYLCGVIYFINFLVPIISLFGGIIPIKIDLLTFGLLGFPLLATSTLIRFFVQNWVMEEKERGFHMVGGILLIGTWWIYIIGLFFTLIRKKVPYDPTPKDGNESNNWGLNIPNIVVGVVSLAAIIYGLSNDWNPYTFVMASIASLNCIFMVFTVMASRKSDLNKVEERYKFVKDGFSYISEIKIKFWKMRHAFYYGIRRLALPVILLITASSFYIINRDPDLPTFASKQTPMKNILYSGVFSPEGTNGLTSMKQVLLEQKQGNTHFDIISLYIPWGDKENCQVPESLINSIYQNKSLPMITWEPWTSLFDSSGNHPDLKMEKKFFFHLVNGRFDSYIEKFALQVKALNRPVYIRFAHEFDNPFYPWSLTGNNSNDEFKEGWKYLHGTFDKLRVNNVIWVWNPWKPEAVESYFPGKEMVDWIGVTCLNYGSLHDDKQWHSFESLYTPFHKQKIFTSGIPVMMAETGSLKSEGRQDEWIKGALKSIRSKFPEIKGLVFFNSGLDKNIPAPAKTDLLDWRIQNPETILASLNNFQQNTQTGSEGIYGELPFIPDSYKPSHNHASLLKSIKGIEFDKGQPWFKNFHTLTKKTLIKDFQRMQSLGINTIKRFGPGIYDRNIFAVAEEVNMKIHYSFWVPDNINFSNNKEALSKLSEQIIERVTELKEKEIVLGWNLGNCPWQTMQDNYFKPELLYQQAAYLVWLKNLVRKIKEVDPSRPVTLDVELGKDAAQILQDLHQELPEIDAFGLIVSKKSKDLLKLDQLNIPYYFSKISTQKYLGLPQKNAGVYITSWQDLESTDQLTFDGLLDHWGREKPSFNLLQNYWTGTASPAKLPEIKILCPARPTYQGTRLTYQALVKIDGTWTIPGTTYDNMKFEWHLIKTDKYGNGIFMNDLGEGSKVSFSIPEDPSTYKLYLVGIKGNNVITSQSTLNTPLFSSEKLSATNK
jgi:cellulose synthase/poly-beta-1,6-N-acetylglucosamine synthase-like glycosyltransferase